MAAVRTIGGVPPAAPADYVLDGHAWFMAVAGRPSGLSGTVSSQVSTDFIQVTAQYLLP